MKPLLSRIISIPVIFFTNYRKQHKGVFLTEMMRFKHGNLRKKYLLIYEFSVVV